MTPPTPISESLGYASLIDLRILVDGIKSGAPESPPSV